MRKETRSFKIAKNMILHTIESQSGSIEKALLECLMNAVDAGASEVDVVIDSNGIDYSVSDNGRGFASFDEIVDCFEIFGFDHETENELEKARVFGTFGIGRAQLWAFSSNVWYTNEFVLDVNVKTKGLDYDLSESPDKFDGCKIIGKFYEKQTLSEIQTIQRNLIKLALFLPIKFTLNGNIVSKELSEQKWTHKTEDAYIRFVDTGDLLVYNQGVFVCSYSNYEYGKGGVVVTNKKLELNTARNDILKSKCKVWKKLSKYLKEESTKENLSKKTLTDDSRKNLLLQWLSGDLSFQDLKGKGVLPDIKGKFRTLTALEKSAFRVTVADNPHSQIGENIYAAGNVFVFSPLILEWLGIDDPALLGLFFDEKISSDIAHRCKLDVIDFNTLKSQYNTKHTIITPDKYTKKQKVFMEVYQSIVKECAYIVNSQLNNYLENKIQPRTALLGKSESAEAWTDSFSYIAIEEKSLAMIDQGNRGINRVINLVLHEYLHNEASYEDHVHSLDFFENFHDMILDRFVSINTLLIDMNKKYVKLLIKNNLAIPREYLRESRRENDILKAS